MTDQPRDPWTEGSAKAEEPASTDPSASQGAPSAPDAPEPGYWQTEPSSTQPPAATYPPSPPASQIAPKRPSEGSAEAPPPYGHTPPYGQGQPPYGQGQPPYGQSQPPYGQSSAQGQPAYGPGQPTYGQGQPTYGAGAAGQPGATAYYPSQTSPPAAGGSARADNFFASLLDFTFTKYGTPSIVKIVYPLIAIVIVLYYLTFTALAFQTSSSLGVFVLLVLGPLAMLVTLAMARMTLEFYLAVVRIAQDVREVKDRSS